MSSILFVVRMPREWRYLSFDRANSDVTSTLLEELRWTWNYMKDIGVLVYYQNKYFNIIRGPVPQQLYAQLEEGFRTDYCPPYGF